MHKLLVDMAVVRSTLTQEHVSSLSALVSRVQNTLTACLRQLDPHSDVLFLASLRSTRSSAAAAAVASQPDDEDELHWVDEEHGRAGELTGPDTAFAATSCAEISSASIKLATLNLKCFCLAVHAAYWLFEQQSASKLDKQPRLRRPTPTNQGEQSPPGSSLGPETMDDVLNRALLLRCQELVVTFHDYERGPPTVEMSEAGLYCNDDRTGQTGSSVPLPEAGEAWMKFTLSCARDFAAARGKVTHGGEKGNSWSAFVDGALTVSDSTNGDLCYSSKIDVDSTENQSKKYRYDSSSLTDERGNEGLLKSDDLNILSHQLDNQRVGVLINVRKDECWAANVGYTGITQGTKMSSVDNSASIRNYAIGSIEHLALSGSGERMNESIRVGLAVLPLTQSTGATWVQSGTTASGAAELFLPGIFDCRKM